MRYSTHVKSISWLKTNAAEALQRLSEQREPLLITQNGEARAVIVDVASYEEQQETMALLKLLAMGERDVEEGRTQPLADAIADLKAELSAGTDVPPQPARSAPARKKAGARRA